MTVDNSIKLYNTNQPSIFKYWNLECNNLTVRISVSRIKLARAFNEQWKPSKIIRQICSAESFKHTHAKPKIPKIGYKKKIFFLKSECEMRGKTNIEQKNKNHINILNNKLCN